MHGQAQAERAAADRWQALQARAERRHRQAAAGRCARCRRRALPDGTRCARHSATTAAGQAWRQRQARRRYVRTRGAVRAIAWIAAGAIAWQVAGIVADGAVAGIGGTPSAHGAQVTAPGSGRACVAIDTGRNVARHAGRAYRYSDHGDGIVWQAGTPRTALPSLQDGRRVRRGVA